MVRRHSYWIEKLQIQLTAVGAGLAAYFLIWPIVSPTDPTGPVAFVATGALAKAGLLTASVCALAALCCLTTVSARPAGTMTALLIGLGGVSLHSGPMRELLWARQADLAAMYWQMALEVLIMAAILLIAAVVVALVRRAAAGIAGEWSWTDLLTRLSEDEQRAYLRPRDSGNGGDKGALGGLVGGGFARIIVEHLALAASRRAGRRMPDADVLTRCGLCFLLCLTIAVSVVWMLAQSAERGQLLFALLAGCFLATLIAYQVFPTRLSLPAWAAPITAAVGYYVLAAVGALSTGQGAWMAVDVCRQALPIDWMTAGVGGGMLGYWVSSRTHESKFLEHVEGQEEGA
ncbi:MAG: hypothetical protein WBF17_19460 [Phycisphaerae bacterium]